MPALCRRQAERDPPMPAPRRSQRPWREAAELLHHLPSFIANESTDITRQARIRRGSTLLVGCGWTLSCATVLICCHGRGSPTG